MSSKMQTLVSLDIFFTGVWVAQPAASIAIEKTSKMFFICEYFVFKALDDSWYVVPLGMARLFYLLSYSLSTWHLATITAFERAAVQMQGLRCAVPPYYVAGMSADGEPVVALPGDTYEMLERGLAPTAQESRMTLIRLRQTLRWSRAGMAAYLGVNRGVLRRWETGERNPSGAARRLIWLLDVLAHEPDKLKSAVDLFVWGRGEECLEFSRQLAKSEPRPNG